MSPDRTYWLDESRARDNKGIVECKSTMLKVDAETIPHTWFCQLMYQLGVMGYQQGSLAWMTLSNRSFGVAPITFDRSFYQYMTEQLDKFWIDNIVNRQEPAAATIEDVMIKFPRSSAGKTVEVTDEVMEAINEIKCTKPLIKELEAKVKEAEDTVKTYMADAETLCLPGTLDDNPQAVATWRTGKDRTKFDEKAFKAEHADLYEQFTKTVPGNRTFLVK